MGSEMCIRDRYKSDVGRPYQINIWYPCVKGSGQKFSYSKYVDLIANQTDFIDSEELSAFSRTEFISKTNDLGGNGKFTKIQLDSLMELSVISEYNASPIVGSFPVVLYPNGTGPGINNITCEFLASHGYIVVGFSAKGRYSSGLEISSVGLEVGARDIEFVLHQICLLYTSPSPRDLSTSRMPSSA